MNMRIPISIIALAVALPLAGSADAAVVFQPGEKTKYVPPGEEEMSGSAKQLWDNGQEAERKGNLRKAIRAYRVLVRKYPKDALASGAGFRCAQLLEAVHDYANAADVYRYIVEKYPSSPHFDEAIEGQFRIGEMYLNGHRAKLLGLSFGNSLEKSVEIFAAVIRTAPYGKYTARAQFDIGLAREKQKITDAAISAYSAVAEKFPNDILAPNAQYQVGYLWMNIAKAGTKDIDATEKARTAFEDFLFRFPNSEKAPQARANLEYLSRKQITTAFDIAKYYDKQKHYRAAVIYYNEVIRQQPGSNESERAKKRIDQIKAKVGEKALLPVGEERAVAGKKSGSGGDRSAASQSGASSTDSPSTPLPPAEADPSLPPAASLLPDTTTAPVSSGSSSSSGSVDSGLGSSETSASPEATPSPAP
jgi:outer membrane protein assembly factor BamD